MFINFFEKDVEFGEEDGEVGVVGKQIIEIFMVGERILEVLEFGMVDLSLLKEYEKVKEINFYVMLLQRNFVFFVLGDIIVEVYVMFVL